MICFLHFARAAMAFTLLFAPTIDFQRCSWLSSTIVTKKSKQKKCVHCVCFAKNRLHYAKSQKLVCVPLRLQTDWLFTLRSANFLNAHQPRRQSRYAHFVSRAKGSLSAMEKKQIRLREIPFFCIASINLHQLFPLFPYFLKLLLFAFSNMKCNLLNTFASEVPASKSRKSRFMSG